MELWMIVLIAVVALAVLSAIKLKQDKAKAGPDDQPWPYQARRIMTDREQVLYHRLREALPDCLIFTQVQLSQVISVKYRAKNPQTWLNKISQKSVDFVVCQPDSSVLAVIELDDKSHNNAKQATRDADKSKALKDAGVKLIRVREVPSVATICKAFGRKPAMPKGRPADMPGMVVQELDSMPESGFETSSGFLRTQSGAVNP